jgi:hypothetical protein
MAATEPLGPLPDGDKPGWRASLNAVPGARIVIDVFTSWWSQHPLRAVALVGVEAGNAVMKPTAQRHPLLLVVGALIVGAALVRLKPWRWGLKKVLLAGLLPQLISKGVSELPVASWMALVSQLIQEKQPRTDANESASAPSADE